MEDMTSVRLFGLHFRVKFKPETSVEKKIKKITECKMKETQKFSVLVILA